MPEFLFVTHGHMATGVKSTLEIITGSCPNLTSIDAYVDSENIVELVDKYFDRLPDDKQLIMLSDIENGSANQLLFKHLDRPNTFLIAGTNFPLVLQLVLNGKETDLTEKDLKNAISEARDAIKLFQELNLDDDDSESFF